ncbi:hypothetical protein [Ruminococcus flavefaciens]|uniref:Uncharacterized protein n=1 Tax=Ruminococcus flavefaciens TaxID=1265 RepID=A0A1K1PX52_RUMFL|nr:hypothetical protein [Ruminococcus flavefaciens]SFW52208.1 hypothetical protein SAMN02910280_0230 [Ruminococcus flavefaciens]
MRTNDYNDLLKKIKCTDDFRSRMQQKLTSAPAEMTEYADSVSGTDVITAKHRFGRAAALAAAFVLVCGAVGGGAYYLARINNKTEESTNINTEEKDSIYSRLKANKELFYGDMVINNDSEVIYRGTRLDIEPFIKYMDQFNTENEIEKEDFYESGRSITIDFYGKENEEEFAAKIAQAAADETINKISLYDEASYNFTLYNNGCYTMTDNEYNRTTYHCFTDGEKVFNDILEMYADENTLERLHTVTNKELENEINNGFKNSTYDKAYYYPAGETDGINYKIVDREGFANELRQYSWERVNISHNDVNRYDVGFIITEDGYMEFDTGKIFRLKEDTSLESFKNVLASHLKLNEFGTDASKEDILNAFHEGYNGGRARFRVDDGQFTEETECTLENFESFKDEISELEWVTCETSNRQIYMDFYVAGALISRNGYLYPQSGGTHQCAYKLKNESDIEKLCEICDKYITKNTNENANENDSIYSKLTANKENYSVDLDDDIKKKDIDKDILFEYLDKYDMTSEIGPSSYTSSDKKITVFFRKIGEEKKDYSYVGATERYDYKLVIYDTGTFTWTENDNGKEKLTMHRFDDGGKIYQDIIDIFAD